MNDYITSDALRNIVIPVHFALGDLHPYSPVYARLTLCPISEQQAKTIVVDQLLEVADRDASRARYLGRVIVMAWPGFKAA